MIKIQENDVNWMIKEGRKNRGEVLFWSIAFPGFGQFLNGKYVKGVVLVALEFLINVMSNMNRAIVSSFHGDITQAIYDTDLQWLLFYPCVYLFGIWDAYRDAGGGREPYSFLPFVFSAYFGTIGVIYSPILKIYGVLWGPIWLSILFLLLGYGVGLLIRLCLNLVIKKKSDVP
jgi:hypothetical protein